MILTILAVCLLLAGLIALVIYHKTVYGGEGLQIIGGTITVIGGFAVFLATIFMISGRISSRGNVISLNAIRDQLVAQYNDAYKESQTAKYIIGDLPDDMSAIKDYNATVATLKSQAESPFTNWFVVSEAKDLKVITFDENTHLAKVDP